MNEKNTNPKRQSSGLTILPDGRVQVIFENLDMEKVTELPKHVYNLVQELAFSDHEFTRPGKTGLYFVLEATKELIPDYKDLPSLLEKSI